MKYFCWIFPFNYTDFRGVNDPAETVSKGSLSPLQPFIDYLGEYKAICETALSRESGP
jgi:hypothetical protein